MPALTPVPGAYTVLYVICILSLLKRRKESYRVFAVLITVLFVIVTMGVGFQYAIELKTAEQNLVWYTINLPDTQDSSNRKQMYSLVDTGELTPKPFGSLAFGFQMLILFGNCITDALLLGRCYILWGQNLRFIAAPAVFCLGVNVYAFVTFVSFPFVICAALGNIVLTGLIGQFINVVPRSSKEVLTVLSRKNFVYRPSSHK
ncbi:hypothetical protein PM082_011358 [Marasmius tenuissimus]|nr:hypothetical protein PM082_011358 [Marasmius tenuissimus]